MRTKIACVFSLAVIAAFAVFSIYFPSREQTTTVYDASGGFTFTGTMRDGKYEGQVYIEFDNGDIYEGGMENGAFEGPGTYKSEAFSLTGQFKNGEIMFASMRANDGTIMTVERKVGENSDRQLLYNIMSPDGSSYEGPIGLLGQRGTGVYTSRDGSFVYNGAFENGKPNGQGTLTLNGAALYTGGFQNGRFHGYGIYTSPEGWIYDGSFSEGEATHGNIS